MRGEAVVKKRGEKRKRRKKGKKEKRKKPHTVDTRPTVLAFSAC